MTKKFFTALFVTIVIVSCCVFLWMSAMPKIVVTPERALIDVPVEIVVSNLSAHEQVTLEATCKDKDDHVWRSQAEFQADDGGVINVATQAPISGSYAGIDPMGLFWSMVPVDKTQSPFFAALKNDVLEVKVSVFSQGKFKADKTIYRLKISPDVEKRRINECGVIGVLFYPKNTHKGPGIIVVPGSNGGIPGSEARLLASHGYTVLALAYFAEEGLSAALENIPLEYFQNAIRWFKEQPQVDGHHVAFLGNSRGGELALLVAATFPQEIHAVVALVPSNLVYGGLPDQNAPTWTYKNKPVPFMPSSMENSTDVLKQKQISCDGSFEHPCALTPWFLRDLKTYSQSIDAATIRVENIRCPILLISGEDDKMWPSQLYCNRIMERLDTKKAPVERKHVHHPDAGHFVFRYPYVPSIDLPFYHPLGKAWLVCGGTVEGNARATKESWREVLAFLEKTL